MGLELSLFIRAMKTFQSLPPEDQISYYRIAGIHGYPYNVPWNMGTAPIPLDDPNMDTRLKDGQGGFYCQHNSYLFPTWHRAYMMLFEVVMHHSLFTAKDLQTDCHTYRSDESATS